MKYCNEEKSFNGFKSIIPKIKEGTILAHLTKMSTNVPSRIHNKPDPDGHDDLFYRIDPSRFRLYKSGIDPAPIYPPGGPSMEGPVEGNGTEKSSSEFAYEKDLQNFLSKNLSVIEPGLKLYEDEGINGIEFGVGGRYIGILAVDKANNYVVIELKVSRGYDRVIGQILRYMAWIHKNQADEGQSVRGIIIAKLTIKK
jgi:hypothetical protein